jgi:hypothetical protein
MRGQRGGAAFATKDVDAMAARDRDESTVVGYWSHSPDDSTLPYPQANPKPWNGQGDFVAKLKVIEQGIRAHRYGKLTAYRGFSMCRLCAKLNGSEEFEHAGYRWPSGFLHYIEAHNVRPPQDFADVILKLTP